MVSVGGVSSVLGMGKVWVMRVVWGGYGFCGESVRCMGRVWILLVM